jgi:hypothetical protein
MTVDPADDCTFWYTQEYIKANGTFNWSTRIANFKFSNCGAIARAAVSLSTSKLNFPKTPIGHTSPSQSVTLTNNGSGTLQISGIDISGDFAIASNTCHRQLSAGNSCTVSITFAPTFRGTRKGTLSFSDNVPGSPQTVTLTGIAGFSFAVRELDRQSRGQSLP